MTGRHSKDQRRARLPDPDLIPIPVVSPADVVSPAVAEPVVDADGTGNVRIIYGYEPPVVMPPYDWAQE